MRRLLLHRTWRLTAGVAIVVTLWVSLGQGQASEGAASQTRLPAFPGAEGFGAYTPGGRGGKVLAVTNLLDYVPGKEEPIRGSFRAACNTKGPRIIVFRVAGLIELKAALVITEPFVTVAGQTSPGDGICLKNWGFVVESTHDVIIRHLRCRPGDVARRAADALSIHTSQNIILDHCSASWGSDEVLSVVGEGTTNITVQWCIISEGLNRSYHQKGAHGYGSLLRIDGNMTFHHNLFAHHNSRNPRPGTYGKPPGLLLDFRNNLIYNWGKRAGYSAKDAVRMNYVANYLKPGPSTTDPGFAFTVGGDTTALFVADNYMVGGADKNRDNWQMIRLGEGIRMKHPFPVIQVQTDSAKNACHDILESAGATLPVRDGIDRRVVAEVKTGRGRIIDSQSDVGGWGVYKEASLPVDTDDDGMPDRWESRHGLDPNNASDNKEDRDGDTYTNIEEFLNSTDPNTNDVS